MGAENTSKDVRRNINQNGLKIRTNDELQVMHSNPNIVTIQARRMSDERNIKYFWGNQMEKEKQEDQK
jgi:hypothetical protein